MKTLFLSIFTFLFIIGMYSQNTNVKSEEKIVKTTIKDSKGEKTIVKKEKIKEVQDIKFENPNSPKTNKNMKPTPVNVTTTKQVIVDGKTKYVDVDHSAYYNLDGVKYEIKADKSGYLILDNKKKKASGVLRKTSNNNYIFRNKNKVAVGYFDENGNLILETYDPKTDSMIMEKYMIENK